MLTTLPIYLVLIIFGFAASFILIYVYRYQSQFSEKKPMRSRRGGTLKAILETVSDDQKTAFIEKQQKTMEIIAETKKKISDRVSEQGTSIPEEMTKKYLAMDSAQEKAVLKDAEKFLKIYASAEPVTEEQRKQDMEELLKAAETLEKMESETQLVDVEERFSNVGYGLWMDTVSQAIRKIIKDTNIRKHGILQVEKLMSFLPRKFDVKDIRNALQLLKKAKEIVDIVELSSNVLAIAFTSEAAQLTISEKVLLATLSDEFEVTKQKIKNIFNWDDAFLNQAVVKLQALNILTMKGDKLSAEGLFTPKDKAELEQKKAVQQPKSPPAIVVPSAGSQGEPPVATRTPVDMAKIPSIPAVPKVPPVPARQPADGTPAPATATAPAPPVKAPPAVPVPKPVALPPKPAETPQVKAVPSVPLPPIKGLPAVKSPVSAPAKPPVTPPVAGKPAVLPPKAPTQQPAVLPPKAPTQQPAVLPPKAPTQQPAVLPPKVPAPKPFEKPAPPRAPEAPFVPKPAAVLIQPKPGSIPATGAAPPTSPQKPSLPKIVAVPPKPGAPKLTPVALPKSGVSLKVVRPPAEAEVKVDAEADAGEIEPPALEETTPDGHMKGFVQVGHATPINETQRKMDIDDLMKAMAELEEESTFSSGKDNLGIFNRQGEKVNSDELIKQTKIPGAQADDTPSPEVEMLAEKILAVYEKQEILNGGLMQFSKLKILLKEEAGEYQESKFQATLEVVKSMGMISRIVALPGTDEKLVLFKDIPLDPDELRAIQFAIGKPVCDLTKDSIGRALGFDEERVLSLLKGLQDKGIIRITGKDAVQIPGIIQG